jgi:hypothetical protein
MKYIGRSSCILQRPIGVLGVTSSWDLPMPLLIKCFVYSIVYFIHNFKNHSFRGIEKKWIFLH